MDGLPRLAGALKARCLQQLAALAGERDDPLVNAIGGHRLHQAGVADAVDAAVVLSRARLGSSRAGEVLLRTTRNAPIVDSARTSSWFRLYERSRCCTRTRSRRSEATPVTPLLQARSSGAGLKPAMAWALTRPPLERTVRLCPRARPSPAAGGKRSFS